jgi:hypothetical protein
VALAQIFVRGALAYLFLRVRPRGRGFCALHTHARIWVTPSVYSKCCPHVRLRASIGGKGRDLRGICNERYPRCENYGLGNAWTLPRFVHLFPSRPYTA